MAFGDVLDSEAERVATEIVDGIFKVHSTFGAGLLESVRQQCMQLELES